MVSGKHNSALPRTQKRNAWVPGQANQDSEMADVITRGKLNYFRISGSTLVIHT